MSIVKAAINTGTILWLSNLDEFHDGGIGYYPEYFPKILYSYEISELNQVRYAEYK